MDPHLRTAYSRRSRVWGESSTAATDSRRNGLLLPPRREYVLHVLGILDAMRIAHGREQSVLFALFRPSRPPGAFGRGQTYDPFAMNSPRAGDG